MGSRELASHLIPLGLILLAALVGMSTAQIIILDEDSDSSGLWNDNSCYYGETPDELGVYGCSVDTTPGVLDPSGYWANCKPKTTSCDIIFNSGYLPYAKKLWMRAYMNGSARITIVGKNSLNDLTYFIPIGEIDHYSTMEAGWHEVEFDMSLYAIPPRILKITLTSHGPPTLPSYTLLDAVSVNLGDRASAISLDTQDNEVDYHWNSRDNFCAYAEDSRDFLYFGCPAELPGIDKREAGYWKPCLHSSCQLSFFSGPSVHPGGLAIKGYMNGTGELRIFSEGDPKTEATNLVKTLNVGNTGGGWFNEIVDLHEFPNNIVVIFQLVGSEENVILIDSVTVCTDDSNGYVHESCDPTKQVTTTKAPGTGGGSSDASILNLSVPLFAMLSFMVNYMNHE